jgi:hypothetical protein
MILHRISSTFIAHRGAVGSSHFGIGDGSIMTFSAGDVFLAEDVTGQGHTAKPHQWVRAYIDI